jgi:hypothetical protein
MMSAVARQSRGNAVRLRKILRDFFEKKISAKFSDATQQRGVADEKYYSLILDRRQDN